jgi:hypothetical protein
LYTSVLTAAAEATLDKDLMDDSLLIAVLVVAVAIYIIIVVMMCRSSLRTIANNRRSNMLFARAMHASARYAEEDQHIEVGPRKERVDDSAFACMLAQQSRVERMDPDITGQLYAGSDGLREVTPPGGHALHCSTNGGISGEVGCDQGPEGLAGYGGETIGALAGMPQEFLVVDAGVSRTDTGTDDYYGPDGPTVYSAEGLHSVSLADHSPLE